MAEQASGPSTRLRRCFEPANAGRLRSYVSWSALRRYAAGGLDNGSASVARLRDVLRIAQSVVEHLLNTTDLVFTPYHRAVLVRLVQTIAQRPAARAAPRTALDEPARSTRLRHVPRPLELASVPDALLCVGEVRDAGGGGRPVRAGSDRARRQRPDAPLPARVAPGRLEAHDRVHQRLAAHDHPSGGEQVGEPLPELLIGEGKLLAHHRLVHVDA